MRGFLFGLLYLIVTRGLLIALGLTCIFVFLSGPQGLTAPLFWLIAVCSVGLMDDSLLEGI